MKHAKNRTVDVVPSLNILAAQLYAWSKLSNEQKQIQLKEEEKDKDVTPLTKQDFEKLTWFVCEETSRRNLKRDAQPLSRPQILSLLMPGHEKVVL